MPSTESTSNWDFTPVIDLLRSPTYLGSTSNTPRRHREPLAVSSPSGAADANNGTTVQHDNPNDTTSHRRLGDFGFLWQFLSQTTPSPSTGGASAPVTKLKVSDTSHSGLHSPRLPKATALAPPHVHHVDLSIEAAAQTPTKPIRIVKRGGTGAIPNKKAGTSHGISGHDIPSGASSEETDSDGDLSVFEPPIAGSPDALPLAPSQVAAPTARSGPLFTPPSSCDESDLSLASSAVKFQASAGYIRIQPIKYKSTTERRAGLVLKLLKNFPDSAPTVADNCRPEYAGVVSDASSQVHVFVDCSNIMIGFHDCVKVSRNIPITTRVRRLPLSFQNLSLILERERPVAKRVLVGSDRFAAINEAEKIGYETNILDRVHKVKQFTPRQLKFRNANGCGGSSGSEMNAHPPERWVEQGVDEILHLKILESLVDSEKPATIVLATGDAAEAEYSGGFLQMVTRALSRGWTVELVSFSPNTSYAYKRPEFRAKWGSRFKMFHLDDYIEELLEM